MTLQEAEKTIQELSQKINYYNERYYLHHESLISDYEFDKMLQDLILLENQYPTLKKTDSPSQRVGGGITKNFDTVVHRYPMLSLSNTYNEEELTQFGERVEKGLRDVNDLENLEYICELKFDGVAISILYENGILTRAVTRGDGVQGDEVTANVRTIRNLPLRLEAADVPPIFEVRGEIFMPKEQFEQLNLEIEEENKIRTQKGIAALRLLANPRNAASGAIKMQDSAQVAKRGLRCYVYEIYGEKLPFVSHEQGLKALESWKFEVSPHWKKVQKMEEAIAFIQSWEQKRFSLPLDTDGMVVKVNLLAQRESLGLTAKSPRWAIAYKYKPQNALTILQSVDFQVGRTGAVTPVANLKPVKLAGTTVKRATLHNADEIQRLDLHIGDSVWIEKSGEIIPKITGIDKSRRPLAVQPIAFPTLCPECNTTLVKEIDQVAFYCPNETACPPQVCGKIVHFTHRKAMNIESLGEKTIQAFYAQGWLQNVADLYDLDPEKILTLPNFKEKSVQNIIEGLEKSKQQPFKNLLFALGIRYIGKTTADILADYFGSMQKIEQASKEEIASIYGIGEKVAESLYDFFQNAENQRLISRLAQAGLQMAGQQKVLSSDILAGKSFVVSGTFTQYDREEIKEVIKNNGGKVVSGVSAKVDFLLAGDKAGDSKLKKAQELKVTILSETDFIALLNATEA
ncbi:NAD-dependent DNA ligase LigA [Hugenholtzia roseola]|uniref:NAD-dependent DNA ligase LigA n=1 Tax=Hugenholtzia roseola TaxID=1002 RepID=UPI000400E971|nr:NAD-dependent DNA ligase LigA [Hugenholtzia roseola]